MFEKNTIWEIEFDPRSDVQEGHEEIHPHLAYYKGWFYCGYKEGFRARIIRSRDGDQWETAHVLSWDAARVMDPRFSITAEGVLMITTNLFYARPCPQDDAEAGPIARQSLTWLSQDGVHWDSTCPSEGLNTIWFQTTWNRGMGYNLAYYGKDAAGTLWRTRDGRHWRRLATEVYPPAHRAGYEEAALAFDAETHQLCALVRAKDVGAIIGTSAGPYYQDWKWQNVKADAGDGQIRPGHEVIGPQLGGPYMIRLQDGRIVAAGRVDASSDGINRGRIDLFLVDPSRGLLTRFAQLDGCGHYPGLVEHDGKLWISCADWEQGHAHAVYLTTVDLPTT